MHMAGRDTPSSDYDATARQEEEARLAGEALAMTECEDKAIECGCVLMFISYCTLWGRASDSR